MNRRMVDKPVFKLSTLARIYPQIRDSLWPPPLLPEHSEGPGR